MIKFLKTKIYFRLIKNKTNPFRYFVWGWWVWEQHAQILCAVEFVGATRVVIPRTGRLGFPLNSSASSCSARHGINYCIARQNTLVVTRVREQLHRKDPAAVVHQLWTTPRNTQCWPLLRTNLNLINNPKNRLLPHCYSNRIWIYSNYITLRFKSWL